MNAFYIALNVFIFICYAILVLCIIGCIAGVLLGIIKKEYKKALCVFDACFGIVGNSTHPSSRYFHQLLPISFGYIQLKRAWEIGEKIV